ncbi:MAG: M18 family aminopeptidase [Polyangiaceae bacterium]|nr:M18 family aminopeptidase [Polyangiaceae bacterium]
MSLQDTASAQKDLRNQTLAAARDLCAFVDRSPSPYHAAREAARRLEAVGFTELDEENVWSIAPGDKKYVLRAGTIVAFVVGSEHPAAAGFRIIGAHTDSPNLRVKPNPDVAKSGYQQIGVEVYGGVILATWTDRDLSLAGRVFCHRSSGRPEARLLDIGRVVARVPNLAIHLNRSVNKDGLVLNEQKHMVPIAGLGKEIDVRALVARELDEKPETILGWDLSLYDTTKATLGGLQQEFIMSSRLDNLASCHAATTALAAENGNGPATRMIVLYDHEECGSRSAAGAAGTVLKDTLARIVEAYPGNEKQAMQRSISRSILVSADMAHALHPNYADQHEPQHQPMLNRGLVIKSNANQSYATDGGTAAFFESVCRDAGQCPQKFVVRTDLPCGSTIGPITSAILGIRTVDVGAPMLSMHSCREMAGTEDVYWSVETFRRVFRG